MANWTNTSRAYLSGTITSTLVLDSANTGAGSIPSSWNTYDDGTYSDSTYTPTAVFNGQVDSTIGRPRLHITQSGDSGDIKYRFRTSPTGSSWGSWSSLTDSYGKEYFDADNRWIDLEVIFYSPLWSDSDYFGIQTVGAQFIRFQKNETIYAEEMNSNFNYLAGNRLPYGGSYLLPSTSVYNIGDSSRGFKAIHYTGTFHRDNRQLYTLLVETEIPVGSKYVDLSGLNGDDDEEYFILADSSVQVSGYINGDTGSSGLYRFLRAYGTTATVFTANTSFIVDNVCKLRVKSGIPRMGISNMLGQLPKYACSFYSSTDTVTSLSFYVATTATTAIPISIYRLG